MGRKKGLPKTGGRQAGTPNKVSSKLKDFLTDVLDENREQIRKDLKSLEPKDRLTILEKFMQYVTPKKHEEDIDNPFPFGVVKVKYIGSDDEIFFPSSEDEVDLERDERYLK